MTTELPLRNYHCYIGYMESVYHSDVMTRSPEQAAGIAAAQHGIDGPWTVIPGDPVTVDVVVSKTYAARSSRD